MFVEWFDGGRLTDMVPGVFRPPPAVTGDEGGEGGGGDTIDTVVNPNLQTPLSTQTVTFYRTTTTWLTVSAPTITLSEAWYLLKTVASAVSDP